MKTNLLLTMLIVLLSAMVTTAQSPGQIFMPANPPTNPMDPNGDGWITNTEVAFSSAVDEEDEFELEWRRVNNDVNDYESTSDASVGGTCGVVNIIDNDAYSNSSSYFMYDHTTHTFLFRLRVANNPTGNFGYVVLIDTDNKFSYPGNPEFDVPDDGYIPPSGDKVGNPGFEIEVRLQTQGQGGVHVYNVDDVLGSAGTLISSYPITSHSQRSYATMNSACSALGIFIDFYVPADDILDVSGITINDPIRLVAATTNNGGTALGSATLNDVGSVNDSIYNDHEKSIEAVLSDFNGGTLPVELAAFTLNMANSNAVKLSWTTASEFNTSHFIVERAKAQEEFVPVGIVNAVGFSNEVNNYDFFDQDAKEESPYYYRLKIVDFDGTFEYSKIITLTSVNTASSVVVYPNPVNQGNTITIDTDYDAANVMISDITGRVSLPLDNLSNNSYTIPDNLPKGTYFITITDETGTQSHTKLLVK